MENSIINTAPVQETQTAKKEYNTPEFICYGTINDLVKNQALTGADGGSALVNFT